MVKAHVGSPACMNKGFILDGYPRNIADAKAVFLEPIPGYEPASAGEEEKKEEVKGEASDSGDPFPGFNISEKILPQYTVIFEAENELLKQKMRDLPPE